SGSATAPGKSPLATSCSVDSYLGLVLLAKATSSHVSVLSLQKAIAFSVSTTVVVVLHILPVDGTLVQDHHVGKQPVKQVVHRPGHLLQHIRQAAPLRPVKIAEGGF